MSIEPSVGENAYQFIKGYAKRSGITIKFLLEHNRVPYRCVCDYKDKEHWSMGLADSLDIFTADVVREALLTQQAQMREELVKKIEKIPTSLVAELVLKSKILEVIESDVLAITEGEK